MCHVLRYISVMDGAASNPPVPHWSDKPNRENHTDWRPNTARLVGHVFPRWYRKQPPRAACTPFISLRCFGRNSGIGNTDVFRSFLGKPSSTRGLPERKGFRKIIRRSRGTGREDKINRGFGFVHLQPSWGRGFGVLHYASPSGEGLGWDWFRIHFSSRRSAAPDIYAVWAQEA